MPQRLQKILKKSPIIPTAMATTLAQRPDRIEALYAETVQTHMSIGDTGQYEKRLLECILRNNSTFNGAVVGDYGFGKTSILIYFWKYCLDNKIMAVPPYQWDKFEEHILVINAWLLYKLRNYDRRILDAIQNIYLKYRVPTIENEAKRWSETHNVDLNTALKLVTDLAETGKISLVVKADDIINYCEEVTNYLQENTEYKGLVVFTDELQQTITQLNQTKVFEFLFDITNHLVNKKGNFGFVWGFPITTQADLQRTRSDILDRLNSNKFFVKLFDIYDATFPSVLWSNFCKHLEIENLQEEIVEKAVLVAVGQICEGDRRDLGNGPRSVISAFNRIAGHFINQNCTYNVLDLVNDCLDDQIALGDRSEFKKRLNSILTTPGFNDRDLNAIKLIAAFPNGIPDDVITQYSLSDDINELIRKTGGLGKVVVKDINTYILKVMRKSVNGAAADTVLEDEVRKYFSQFSPDRDHENIALLTFNDLLKEDLFKGDTGSRFESWKLKEASVDYSCNNHIFRFEGSFNEKYPLRKCRVITRINGRCPEVNPPVDAEREEFSFTFTFHKSSSIPHRVVRIKDCDSYLLNLSFNQQPHTFNDHKINDIVPDEKQSPMFFLGLINHLRKSNIPHDETKLMEHLISVIKENIFENLFNEDLLGDVENSNIELNNQSERLLKDLFDSICESRFGDYVTLMSGSNWKSKINGYIHALKVKDDSLGPLELRGASPVVFSEEKGSNKQKLAGLFGVGSSTFESNIAELKSFARYRNGDFYFLMHPLETWIQNLLDNQGCKVEINSKECLSLDFNKNVTDIIRSKGYTEDELELIMQIMEARGILVFNRQDKQIYKVLENKDQLRSSIFEYYQKLLDYLAPLKSLGGDLPVSESDLEEIRKKIDLVESNEQASVLRINIKSLLGRLIVYASSGLRSVQVNLQQIKDFLRGEISNLKNIVDVDMKDFPPTSLVWQNELARRRFELINEANTLVANARSMSDKATSLLPSEISDVETVICSYVTICSNYSEFNEGLDTFKDNCGSAKDRSKNLVKWKALLKIADTLNEKLLCYAQVFDSDSFQTAFDSFNQGVFEGLRDNPNITLKNYENFKSEMQVMMNEVTNFISNLRNEWESKVEYCKKQLKRVTGVEPNWRLRWGDLPAVAYADLRESLQNDLKVHVARVTAQFTQMEDDVIYTKEVLGHAVAVKNRNIQERIEQAKEALLELVSKSDDEGIYKNQVLEPLIDELVKINTEFGELNRAHASIIKPTPIDDEDEHSFFNFLDKADGLDLKSLIISYQKVCHPDIDLSESRDQVLVILKSLFLKKQITIQVKRGKV